MKQKKSTLALIILDGWGVSDETQHNAIAQARTPVWDRLWSECPHKLIQGSGEHVGLPSGQMGNSEVGHLNIGAGRVVQQEYTRIEKAVVNSGLADNEVLCSALEKARVNRCAVHILGLLSPGGVHSHEDQILAMMRLAAESGVESLYLHAFLDGRDTPPRSAEHSLKRAGALLDELGTGRIASICGRYYAMDRDQRWDRIELAYDLLRTGASEYCFSDPLSALQAAYAREENDEFVSPTVVAAEDGHPAVVADGDVVIFMNFRADRARQITRAFTEKAFTGFERQLPDLAAFVCLTEYSESFGLPVAFPPTKVRNGLGEVVSNHGLTQLRIAETEKYAHVTFFFNGGEEKVFPGEDRILVPSPKVATYDLQPEMNAKEVTDHLVRVIQEGTYDVIICNYANPDMVGHSGKMDAAIKAVETIDECLGRLESIARETGSELLITADHGNIEGMMDPVSGQPQTSHTNNPVPLLYIGREATMMQTAGALSDIAPTMLWLKNIDRPAEMTGTPQVDLIRA